MPPAQVRDIGIGLADALAAAHAAGVLHRDIKPANILVNRFGMVGLSDFGLASIISAGAPAWDRQVSTPTADRQVSIPTVDRQVRTPTTDRQAGRDAVPAGSAAGPSAAGPDAAGKAGRRLSPRHVRLAAGLAVIIAAALVIGARFLPHGASPGAGPGRTSSGRTSSGGTGGAVNVADVFGVATRSAGCPAASLRGAVARCPAAPECFAGLTVISGAASAEPLPCDQPHYWETFAMAILPTDVRTFDQPTVAADPTVRKVCSGAVLLASRQGPARRLPLADWEIQVRSCRPPRPRSTAARVSTAASPTRSGTSRCT